MPVLEYHHVCLSGTGTGELAAASLAQHPPQVSGLVGRIAAALARAPHLDGRIFFTQGRGVHQACARVLVRGAACQRSHPSLCFADTAS
jgi:hypothetical protein